MIELLFLSNTVYWIISSKNDHFFAYYIQPTRRKKKKKREEKGKGKGKKGEKRTRQASEKCFRFSEMIEMHYLTASNCNTKELFISSCHAGQNFIFSETLSLCFIFVCLWPFVEKEKELGSLNMDKIWEDNDFFALFKQRDDETIAQVWPVSFILILYFFSSNYFWQDIFRTTTNSLLLYPYM